MADEHMGPTVTVRSKIEKYHGEPTDGAQPFEVVEFEETIPMAEFLAAQEQT